jgi:hypothetical protein
MNVNDLTDLYRHKERAVRRLIGRRFSRQSSPRNGLIYEDRNTSSTG